MGRKKSKEVKRATHERNRQGSAILRLDLEGTYNVSGLAWPAFRWLTARNGGEI